MAPHTNKKSRMGGKSIYIDEKCAEALSRLRGNVGRLRPQRHTAIAAPRAHLALPCGDREPSGPLAGSPSRANLPGRIHVGLVGRPPYPPWAIVQSGVNLCECLTRPTSPSRPIGRPHLVHVATNASRLENLAPSLARGLLSSQLPAAAGRLPSVHRRPRDNARLAERKTGTASLRTETLAKPGSPQANRSAVAAFSPNAAEPTAPDQFRRQSQHEASVRRRQPRLEATARSQEDVPATPGSTSAWQCC